MFRFIIAALLLAFPAAAYPSSVFFAPTGEAREEGSVNAFIYAPATISLNRRGDPWAGLQLGLLPVEQFKGFAVGGAEIGADVIFLATGPKPVFNGKVQVLRIDDAIHVSIGVLNASPVNGLNLGYVSATSALDFDGTRVGRLTAGAGATLAGPEIFMPTFAPFGLPIMTWAGYETAEICNTYMAAEHISGISEISATNVAMNWMATDDLVLTVGMGISNDSKLYASVLFASIAGNIHPWREK